MNWSGRTFTPLHWPVAAGAIDINEITSIYIPDLNSVRVFPRVWSDLCAVRTRVNNQHSLLKRNTTLLRQVSLTSRPYISLVAPS